MDIWAFFFVGEHSTQSIPLILMIRNGLFTVLQNILKYSQDGQAELDESEISTHALVISSLNDDLIECLWWVVLTMQKRKGGLTAWSSIMTNVKGNNFEIILDLSSDFALLVFLYILVLLLCELFNCAICIHFFFHFL